MGIEDKLQTSLGVLKLKQAASFLMNTKRI